MHAFKTALSALLAGLLFSLGLSLSGMTDTRIVLGFLDLFGAWNPSLMFVMGGALAIATPGFYIINKLHKPAFCSEFSLPTSTIIDWKLLVGAAAFGIGWGLYGYCPGPAFASLANLHADTIIFIVALTIGAIVANRLNQGKA